MPVHVLTLLRNLNLNVSRFKLIFLIFVTCILFNPTVCNELAAVSMSFRHFEKKANMQFQEINRLKLKLIELTESEEYIEKLQTPQFSLDKIKDDDSVERFYIGFPNVSSLLAVFEYFKPKFEHLH